jgi:hypothetical protein
MELPKFSGVLITTTMFCFVVPASRAFQISEKFSNALPDGAFGFAVIPIPEDPSSLVRLDVSFFFKSSIKSSSIVFIGEFIFFV